MADSIGTWVGAALLAAIIGLAITYPLIHLMEPLAWVIPVGVSLALLVYGARRVSHGQSS